MKKKKVRLSQDEVEWCNFHLVLSLQLLLTWASKYTHMTQLSKDQTYPKKYKPQADPEPTTFGVAPQKNINNGQFASMYKAFVLKKS